MSNSGVHSCADGGLTELPGDPSLSGGFLLLDSSGAICSCDETFYRGFAGTTISQIFPAGFRPHDLLRTAQLLYSSHLTRQCTLSRPDGQKFQAKLLLNQIGSWWVLNIQVPSCARLGQTSQEQTSQGQTRDEQAPEIEKSSAVDMNILEDQLEDQIASRTDIARYLHNTVCQNLVAVSLSLARLQRNPEIAAAPGFKSAMDLCDHCSREVRASINVLAPPLALSELTDETPADGPENPVSTLQWYVGNLRETAGLRVTFEVSQGDAEGENATPLPLQTSRFVRAFLCAAVQRWAEAAMNGSAPTGIVLSRRARGLELQIQSEKPGDAPIGAVLSSSLIRECLRAIGGTIESRFSPPGDSVRLVVSDAMAEGSRNKQLLTARAA